MADLLFQYYQREARYIHLLMQEFRRSFPAAAQRLRIEPGGGSADANVERLLQSWALLGGRTHARLDDELPELTDALLQTLYPHFLAPIPSMSIVQLEADPARTQAPEGQVIERGSYLTTTGTQPVPCKFRTAYPVWLWPVRLAEARFQPPPFPAGISAPPGAKAVLRLKLQCLAEQKWSHLQLRHLRFHLHGDVQLTTQLHEALFQHAIQVAFRAPAVPGSPRRRAMTLEPATCLFPVGYASTPAIEFDHQRQETMLPYGPHAQAAYGLLTELFTFPEKFLFFDLRGWDQTTALGLADACEVLIFFDATQRRLEQGISADNLRLNCTPVVNLFEHNADAIALLPRRHEYHVVADAANPTALEVYGIRQVEGVDPASNTTTVYPALHALSHERTQAGLFWHARRQRALDPDNPGTEMYLSLANLQYDAGWPREEALQVHCWCSNRDWPARLHGEGQLPDLQLTRPAPVERVQMLLPPTPTLRPPSRRGSAWQLVAHLSPNYLSLQQPGEAVAALQDLLRLYDFADPDAGQEHLTREAREMVAGIVGVQCRRVLGRVAGAGTPGFSRGLEITVDFDRERYTRTGVLLFASVLEHFFTLYVTANSFTQLAARTESGAVIKRWPPRAGAIPQL